MNKSDIIKDPWLRAWLLVAVVACLAYCFRNVASAIVFSVGFCLIGHSLLAIKYGNTIAGPFSGGYEIKRTNTPRTGQCKVLGLKARVKRRFSISTGRLEGPGRSIGW